MKNTKVLLIAFKLKVLAFYLYLLRLLIFSTIRYSQSADVIFIAHEDGQMIKAERRGVKSWSIVKFFF